MRYSFSMILLPPPANASAAGYIWTRIVCKARHALGFLGEYEYELEVIDNLLTQGRWRRGRRGAWHDRRVLLLTRYLKDPERAKNAAEEGLKDIFTHSSTPWPFPFSQLIELNFFSSISTKVAGSTGEIRKATQDTSRRLPCARAWPRRCPRGFRLRDSRSSFHWCIVPRQHDATQECDIFALPRCEKQRGRQGPGSGMSLQFL